MKVLLAGVAAFAAGFALLPCVAQSTTSAQSAQQPVQAAPQMPGKVVFSRTTDPNGETKTIVGPAAQSVELSTAAPAATDAERQAVRCTAYDMDVRLEAAQQHIAVRARVTVRNDGTAPLTRIPLQISSSLKWESIRLDGRDVQFPVATLNSDADHTGQLHEAAVPLAAPLAPGASALLDVNYSGEIALNAKRLKAIGAPDEAAMQSDWDGIGTDFTGLRGFGDVVWYPVASVPALLGDGAKLFDEIGRQKLRLTGASFNLRLTDEFPQGQAPTVAVVNGHSVPLTVTKADSAEVAGVATANLSGSTLGFQAPSLFIAVRDQHAVAPNMKLWTLAADDAAAFSWKASDDEVTPFLKSWLGDAPHTAVTVLDLPDANDAPFEDGAFLATGVKPGAATEVSRILAHALSHAYVDSPQAWLSEGVADFMGTMWIERQGGRDKALTALGSSRQALALVEPASPGVSAGEPLPEAYTPIYYRTKAVYVLWMLRDLVGDKALASALRAYNAQSANGAAGKSALSLEKCIEQAGDGRDLGWFFSQWINADDGLPDLSIDHVYPSEAAGGNWLVAVDVSNAGYAAAQVPLTVKAGNTAVTRWVMVPAQGKIVQRVLIQGEPTQVQLNDGSVPEVQAGVHVTNLQNTSAAANEPLVLQ
ncbi:MAG TPA: hypothetical protein VGR47_16260 [Terracidiphilus sp.]|nr:hypothetical protein [Terracidiphilus sp.]